MNNLVITNIGKIYNPVEGKFGEVTEYKNASIIIKDGKIEEITDTELEVNAILLERFEVLDAKGGICIPGFVDSHTHPVFANTRELEFEMRNMGKTYLEIAEQGGGIKNSVKILRETDENDLYRISHKRMKKFIEFGTTTVEAKSGYGLTFEDELKMLRVLKKLDENLPLDIVPTCLGAHDIPVEYADDREGYISMLIKKLIPEVAKEKLAHAFDIFIEKGVFTVEEGKRILQAAKDNGLEVKIHADQLTQNNGSALAAELGALSADHVEYISDEAIDAMIEKGVVFNLLPGAAYFIRMTDYPPARKIIDKGGICALSTDFNPGSCYCQSLPLVMNVASVKMGMTAEELLWAATLGGAKALKLDDTVGSIDKDKKADLLILDADNLKQVPYSFGYNLVKNVVKGGKVIR